MDLGREQQPRWHTLVAGIGSGLMSRFLLTPLDVVKIRLQTLMETDRLEALEKPRSGFNSAKIGTVQMTRAVIKESGIRGLWRGTSPSVLLWGMYSGVQFPIYASSMKTFKDDFGFPPSICSFASGACAAFIATLVSYPLDTLRTRVVFETDRDISYVRKMIKSTLREEGVAGFYKGLAPTLAQVVPSMALSFLFYEELKRFSISMGFVLEKGSVLETMKNLGIGSVAGCTSKFVVYPFDSVKKRLQVNRLLGKRRGLDRGMYRSVSHCVRSMYEENGSRTFYRGIFPTLLKSSLATALTFASFEQLLHLLRNVPL